MDRARALAGRQEPARGAQIDDPAHAASCGAVAMDPTLALSFGEAEDVAEDRAGRLHILQEQADAMKAADRRLGRNLADRPAGLALRARDRGQRKAHAVGIAEGDDALAEPLLQRLMGDALFDEAMRPIADRRLGDSENGLLRFADPEPARRGAAPRERRSGLCPAARSRLRNRDDKSADRRN